MATTIDYTATDFTTLQTTLINYIKNTSTFQDVNRSGSNFQLLVQLLAYITEILTYNTNQVANEMNLATVELRKNVLRLIKTLNYLPTRYNSSQIMIDLTITETTQAYLTKFLLKYDYITSGGYKFYYLDDNIELTNPDISGYYYLTGLTFYEGEFVELPNAYVGDGVEFQSFEIADTNVGSYLKVFTYDSIGDIRTYWEKYDPGTYYPDPENTYLYFIEETENGYIIKFGNDHFGRSPILDERIDVEYIRPSGSVANGLIDFTWSGKATNTRLQANVAVDVITAATITTTTGESEISINGAEKESIEEIKYNAPRFNQTQGRAVTEDDYVALIISKAEIDKATALGGDKLTPKELGKVYVTVKPKLDIHPNENFSDAELLVYKNYLTQFSIVTIEPIVQNADYVYLKTTSVLRYSSNTHQPNQTVVKQSIYDFVNVSNATFGDYLEYSKLVKTIDDSDEYITSNLTTVEKFVLLSSDSFVNNTEDGYYQAYCSKNIVKVNLAKVEQYDYVNKLVVQTWTEGSDFDYTILDASNGSIQLHFTQSGGNLGISQTGVADQYEFRFFFETADNDVFLNTFQLFNISTDDMTTSLQKI